MVLGFGLRLFFRGGGFIEFGFEVVWSWGLGRFFKVGELVVFISLFGLEKCYFGFFLFT